MVRSGDDEVRHMDKLMTLEEVADYLRLSNDTVYRMANTGTIPASKVGNQWRFRKEDVDAWLEANKNVGGRPAKGKQRRKK
jgi:excisionase family DNA binding protein